MERRWIELLKDYDCIIDYHLGKANVVVNALSRKAIAALRSLNARLTLAQDGVIIAKLQVKPSLLQQVQEAQKQDEKLATILKQIQEGKENEYEIKGDSYLYYKGRICILDDDGINKSILKEAHSNIFAMHPGSTKMY
ncbi:uncharacterized protein LOC131180091 [Hevea brasiliensis]|uniref:uncharacterized protein LOC131180091 n=1 Tax=Hevea brasiliensis TaxID=3981 RepID=UPI0025D7145D|nr:uncharacterized protein LOC131180091 [Hevea brasiliensis]